MLAIEEVVSHLRNNEVIEVTDEGIGGNLVAYPHRLQKLADTLNITAAGPLFFPVSRAYSLENEDAPGLWVGDAYENVLVLEDRALQDFFNTLKN